jgi:elongation factor G
MPIPEPVFAASVEVGSPSQERALADALAILTRQDPSLHVSVDADTGQTLVRGMGELHLELTLRRLVRDFGLQDARLGPVVVACKERPRGSGDGEATFDRTLGPNHHFCHVAVRVHRRQRQEMDKSVEGGFQAHFGGPEGPLRPVPQSVGDAMREAAALALRKGPIGGFPVEEVALEIVDDGCVIDARTTEVAARAAAAHAVAHALRDAGTVLLEPLMRVEISCLQPQVGTVLNDLVGHRRATVGSVDAEVDAGGTTNRAVVAATVPVRDLVGYATILRSITGGEGRLHMAFARYSAIDD